MSKSRPKFPPCPQCGKDLKAEHRFTQFLAPNGAPVVEVLISCVECGEFLAVNIFPVPLVPKERDEHSGGRIIKPF